MRIPTPRVRLNESSEISNFLRRDVPPKRQLKTQICKLTHKMVYYTPKQRLLIVNMHFNYHYKASEIAQLLTMPSSSVRQILYDFKERGTVATYKWKRDVIIACMQLGGTDVASA